MTQAIPNMNSPLVNKDGLIQKPWNSVFQQFFQAPSGVMSLIVDGSPFSYTFKEPGTLVVSDGTISDVDLIRGTVTVNYGVTRAIVGMIGDIITVTYSVLPTIQFLPFYGGPVR